MIVIDLIGIQSLQQALEMIQAMPVMPSYCRTEHGRQFARVFSVAKRVQKRFALSQNFSDGILQRRSFHRKAPISGRRLRCKNNNTTLHAATARARPKSKPPSSI